MKAAKKVLYKGLNKGSEGGVKAAASRKLDRDMLASAANPLNRMKNSSPAVASKAKPKAKKR